MIHMDSIGKNLGGFANYLLHWKPFTEAFGKEALLDLLDESVNVLRPIHAMVVSRVHFEREKLLFDGTERFWRSLAAALLVKQETKCTKRANGKSA